MGCTASKARPGIPELIDTIVDEVAGSPQAAAKAVLDAAASPRATAHAIIEAAASPKPAAKAAQQYFQIEQKSTHRNRDDVHKMLRRQNSVLSGARSERLLDKYTLGKSLGQGAFGVVYSCSKKGTNDEFAVKMIDRVETRQSEIMREAQMMKMVGGHPCVAKFHEVIQEKVFMCMVMTLYRGGDLIDGMQRHWNRKGRIPIGVIKNITKMMVQSVAWLHESRVIHRDIKGDNFLMDHQSIEHPSCRIYLSDFGTVTSVLPDHRLTRKCGTQTYWAPEFYDLNYSFPVDLWAIGIVTFCLAIAAYPFKNEVECKTKLVNCRSWRSKDGDAFIRSILERNEEKRLIAKQALEHEFLRRTKSAAEGAEPIRQGFKPKIKERGANAFIRERRRELVERLEDAQDIGDPSHGIATAYGQIRGNFVAINKFTASSTKFEWWAQKKFQDANVIDLSLAQKVQDMAQAARPETVEQIQKTLESQGVETSHFGVDQAKEFSDLATELQNGQSRLMLDATQHKKTVRVVDLVLIRLYFGSGDDKRYLVECSEKLPGGSLRENINQLPGTKKHPHESAKQTIARVLRRRMNFEDVQLSFDWTRQESFEEEDMSSHYPGVRTVYRKEIYEGHVIVTDPEILARIGLRGDASLGMTFSHMCPGQYFRTFMWLTEKECQARKVVMRVPDEGADISPLVPPPIVYSEDDLHSFLNGGDGCQPLVEIERSQVLEALSEEMVKGEAQLTRLPDGSLIRLTEVVVLCITRQNGDTLVELNTRGSREPGRLPAVKRRPDENPFLGVKRILNKVLKISENLVKVDTDNILLIEEVGKSKAHGLPTLYRRRVIPATIEEE